MKAHFDGAIWLPCVFQHNILFPGMSFICVINSREWGPACVI